MVNLQETGGDGLRVEYGIEKASNKLLAWPSSIPAPGWGRAWLQAARLLSPFPLSSEAEGRGMKFLNA
jgi:hypothetical protein